MKRYSSYLRAVLLSAISAFILDLALNFEEYQRGWMSAFTHNHIVIKHQESGKVPKEIGKATAMVFIWLFK